MGQEQCEHPEGDPYFPNTEMTLLATLQKGYSQLLGRNRLHGDMGQESRFWCLGE